MAYNTITTTKCFWMTLCPIWLMIFTANWAHVGHLVNSSSIRHYMQHQHHHHQMMSHQWKSVKCCCFEALCEAGTIECTVGHFEKMMAKKNITLFLCSSNWKFFDLCDDFSKSAESHQNWCWSKNIRFWRRANIFGTFLFILNGP